MDRLLGFIWTFTCSVNSQCLTLMLLHTVFLKSFFSLSSADPKGQRKVKLKEIITSHWTERTGGHTWEYCNIWTPQDKSIYCWRGQRANEPSAGITRWRDTGAIKGLDSPTHSLLLLSHLENRNNPVKVIKQCVMCSQTLDCLDLDIHQPVSAS